MKQIFTNNTDKENFELIEEICKKAKNASFELATASTETKNNV